MFLHDSLASYVDLTYLLFLLSFSFPLRVLEYKIHKIKNFVYFVD